MEFSLGLTPPFNLEYTLESGQAFRWENRGEWWYGVFHGGVAKVRQEGDTLRVSSSSEAIDRGVITSYFRLDDDFQSILGSLMREPRITDTIQKFYGLRLMKQDFWECLASFVLATNSNIPRIRGMIESVSTRFGEVTQFEGLHYHLFPQAEILAEASIAELESCGLGYRAGYVRKVAHAVSTGSFNFEELTMFGYQRAHRALLRVLSGEKVLLGVGPKVADCVLLYTGTKDEAFPVDVWILRELLSIFPEFFDERLKKKLKKNQRNKLSLREYEAVSSAAREHFGPYAGYAQLYLYVGARNRG